MAGRNYAAERARLAASAPDRCRTLYEMMRTQLPADERALVGWEQLLTFLHGLGIRRPNGRGLTRRIVQTWSRTDGFPLVRGSWQPRLRTPCLTTTFAVTSWILTRPDTRGAFRVYDPASPISAYPHARKGERPSNQVHTEVDSPASSIAARPDAADAPRLQSDYSLAAGGRRT